MYLKSLKHWDHIREFSLVEAAMLIAGIDPTRESLHSGEISLMVVYERAIAEAVQRANEFAWHHAREIDRLMLHSEANAEQIAAMKMTSDIWEVSDTFDDYLPTIEMRNSVAAVHADPENVPILLPIDPWYTATVYAGDFNTWIKRAGIESAYLFVGSQRVIVTDRESNWDAQQDRLVEAETRGANPIPLESVSSFAERTGVAEKPLATRERNILLSMIAALCKEAKIDYSRPAKAAGLVKDLTVKMGLSVGESTIEAHLKRIPDALEARMK